MVGKICNRQILTMGNIPMQIRSGDSELPPIGTKNPSYGFVNATHTDNNDMLTKDQLMKWKRIAIEKKWKCCLKLLEEPHFCLPTTCGYQFVYQGDAKECLQVRAFFAMDGLGLAMQIEHGVAQHFMGAMFSHQTCVPVCCCKTDGRLSISNHDDNFLIVGWGDSGGHKEVSAAVVPAEMVQEEMMDGGGAAANGEDNDDDEDDNMPIIQLQKRWFGENAGNSST
jgi:hypothetical protein